MIGVLSHRLRQGSRFGLVLWVALPVVVGRWWWETWRWTAVGAPDIVRGSITEVDFWVGFRSESPDGWWHHGAVRREGSGGPRKELLLVQFAVVGTMVEARDV
jgi:hypothetical protein